MHSVFVGIGSNIDRDKNINGGVQYLYDKFGALTLSSVYETIPYGFDGDNFYNLVAKFSCDDTPLEVNAYLRLIEKQFGRQEKLFKYSSRSLDIDLLLYDDLVSNTSEIRVPREDLLKYSFVLCPMAEIAPDLIHPIENKSYDELWHDYDKPRNDLWKIEFEWDLQTAETK